MSMHISFEPEFTMKHLLLFLGFSVFPLSLAAQDHKKEVYTPPSDIAGSWIFTPDPKLPNVLILGDSISIGYTRNVRAQLAGKANVFRPLDSTGKNPINCGDTEMGLEGLNGWITGQHWSVIHCNWGLWDICYRVPGKPKSGNRDKVNGKISLSIDQYVANLDKILTNLKSTGANVIWASTTVVPEGESGRIVGDEIRYNAAAAALMQRRNVPINDLHALTSGWAGAHSAGPSNVHYKIVGNQLLGKQVAEAILVHLK